MIKVLDFHKGILKELKPIEENILIVSPKNEVFFGKYVYDTFIQDDYSPHGKIYYIKNDASRYDNDIRSVEFYSCQTPYSLEGVYVDVTRSDYNQMVEKIEKLNKENALVSEIKKFHWGMHKTLGLVCYETFFSQSENKLKIEVYTDTKCNSSEGIDLSDFEYFCTNPSFECVKNLPFMKYDISGTSVSEMYGKNIKTMQENGIYNNINFEDDKIYKVYIHSTEDSEGYSYESLLFVE